jgi:uncharacterized membrane protein
MQWQVRARQPGSARALRASAALWFVIAVAGQLAFAAYIAAFYGGAALDGEPSRWNRVLVGGWRPGGTAGNAVLAAHLALALVITIGGPLQLIPRLRTRARALHRWNGRVYVATAVVTSLAGLYAVWTRGTAGGVNLGVGISVDAVLILAFAALAVRDARARRFDAHRRWALRLFMAVSGVWFFRVGLMLWLAANGGPVGLGEHFDGPFPTFLSFACYLVPLAVLELYLRAQSGSDARRYATAAGLAVVTLAMAAGIAFAVVGLWLPRF